ncbi:MAG: hypothetical protein IJ382_02305 [Flavobacteriales bacterium]|nr:hypothetical protein [Flavobacteriales bacterium]PWM10532.1 MAG: hypothetical protein DBY00_06570 [Flavobacteriales bacterium]
MNRTSFRLILALAGLAVLIYGFFSGRLQASFQQTPYSTGFIVVVLIIYAAFNVVKFFRRGK